MQKRRVRIYGRAGSARLTRFAKCESYSFLLAIAFGYCGMFGFGEVISFQVGVARDVAEAVSGLVIIIGDLHFAWDLDREARGRRKMRRGPGSSDFEQMARITELHGCPWPKRGSRDRRFGRDAASHQVLLLWWADFAGEVLTWR
jgi:hypothetical protein